MQKVIPLLDFSSDCVGIHAFLGINVSEAFAEKTEGDFETLVILETQPEAIPEWMGKGENYDDMYKM